MFCCLSDVKQELLCIVTYLEIKMISFHVNNAISVSYCYFIYCIEFIGFLLLTLWELSFVYRSGGDKVPLCSAINECPVLVSSVFHLNC